MSKYSEILQVSEASLEADEFWCVLDPGGEPMEDTASKNFAFPIVVFCNALKCDWEDAKEAGYRLGRCRTTSPPLPHDLATKETT